MGSGLHYWTIGETLKTVNTGAKKLRFLSLGTRNISTDTQETN